MDKLFNTEAEEIMALAFPSEVHGQCERSKVNVTRGVRITRYYFKDRSVILLDHSNKEFRID